MKNTYLIDVIRHLSVEEQQDFAAFLANPCFQTSSSVVELNALYEVIIRTAPDFSDDLLSKEVIYPQLFPAKSIVEGKLEKLMAELNKLLRKFLLSRDMFYTDEGIDHQLKWAKWLRSRTLDKRFQQTLSKIKSVLETQQESLEYFQNQFDLAIEEHEWSNANNRIKDDINLPNLIQKLDLYFLNYRIELSNRVLLHQKAGQLPPDNQQNHHLVPSPKTENAESSLLLIVKKINVLIQQAVPSKEEFQELMEAIKTHESRLSTDTLTQLYAYLHSFCTLLIDNGHLEYVHTLFQLYKHNLERGYLFTDNKLVANAYLNIVQIALRAKETDWAVEFTENYKSRIVGGDETQFFYHYSLASCLFAQKKFDHARDLLPENAPSAYYHLMVRRLELKIYYELDHELLPYKIDAFRKYLERTAPKSVAAQNNDMNANFVSILNQLSQSPRKDAKRAAKLSERIQAKKMVAERTWLLEKVRALA